MADSDPHTAEAFVERLFDDLLGAVTVYGVYLGDRLGLYRTLAERGPLTAAELSAHAGIAERYAREWLEQQAADGILRLSETSPEPSARRYALPDGHAEVLTDADSLNFLAPLPRLLTAAGQQLPAILEAMRTGGGVPWSAYGDEMRESQGDQNRPMFLRLFGREYLPQIPEVHARLSVAGARVADVGCGFGWSAIAIAEAYPGVTVDGFDLDLPSVERARTHAAERGLGQRVRFEARDIAEVTGGYDLAFAGECIHDMPQPMAVLREMRRLVEPAGSVLIMDERVAEEFVAPASEVDRLMYGFSLMVCLPDGLSHPSSAGTGTVMRPATLRSYARAAGFTGVDVLPIENDLFRFYRLRL